MPHLVRLSGIVTLAAALIMGGLDFGLQTPSNLLLLTLMMALYLADNSPKKSWKFKAWIPLVIAGCVLGAIVMIYPFASGTVSLARARIAMDSGRYATAAEWIARAETQTDDDRILETAADIALALSTMRGSPGDHLMAQHAVDAIIDANPLAARYYASRAALRRIVNESDSRIGSDLFQAFTLNPANLTIKLGYLEYLLRQNQNPYRDGVEPTRYPELAGSTRYTDQPAPDRLIAQMIMSMPGSAELRYADAFSGLCEMYSEFEEWLLQNVPAMRATFAASLIDALTKRNNERMINGILLRITPYQFENAPVDAQIRLIDRAHHRRLDPIRNVFLEMAMRDENRYPPSRRAMVYRYKGDAARCDGMAEDAMRWYRQAVYTAPGDFWHHKALADLISEIEGDNGEIRYWLSVKQFLPASHRLYVAMGAAYERQGELNLALMLYRQAEDLEPGSTRDRLKTIRMKLGLPESNPWAPVDANNGIDSPS